MSLNHITVIGISQTFDFKICTYRWLACNHKTAIGISQTFLLQDLNSSMAWNHTFAIGISQTFLLQDT